MLKGKIKCPRQYNRLRLSFMIISQKKRQQIYKFDEIKILLFYLRFETIYLVKILGFLKNIKPWVTYLSSF